MYGRKRPSEYVRAYASIKAKMLGAGPNSTIDLTASETQYVLNNDITDLVKEVEKERAAKVNKTPDPDHKAHLDAVEQPGEFMTFEDAVRPLMRYLSTLHKHPHAKVIVEHGRAELVEDLICYRTSEFF